MVEQQTQTETNNGNEKETREEKNLEEKQRREREQRMDKTIELLEPQSNRLVRAVTGEKDDQDTENARIISGDTNRVFTLLDILGDLGVPHASVYKHHLNVASRALSPEISDFGQRGEVLAALAKQETKKKELETPAQEATRRQTQSTATEEA